MAVILNLLEGVRQTGTDAWSAKCPAHEDRVSSLVVKQTDDGRWLIHCFAGCSVYDVLGALGLGMTDLFPERRGHRLKPVRRVITATEALRGLAFESGVVAIASSDIADGKALSAEDADRVAVAAGRIAEALEVVHGRMD